jgi:CheY-like chemotaxis protein
VRGQTVIARAAEEKGRPGLSVLVVEDHQDCADSMAMLLGIYGHEVRVARDGPAALEAARAGKPDVVLVDIGLPGGMDGWMVAERIRGLAGGKGPLLVALTGFGREDDRRRSAGSGIDIHLTKPVAPEELEATLRAYQEMIAGG